MRWGCWHNYSRWEITVNQWGSMAHIRICLKCGFTFIHPRRWQENVAMAEHKKIYDKYMNRPNSVKFIMEKE